MTKGVTLQEIRARVLLRHSQLRPDDKRRVILEAKGDLRYAETVKAIKLPGSHFFHHFQGKGGGNAGRVMEQKSKVYGVHMTEADSADGAHLANGQAGDEDMMDEDILRLFLESCDEDAICISEFEDAIVDAVQESSLAPVFAIIKRREPVSGEGKDQGYWPVSTGKGSKGRGKGKRDQLGEKPDVGGSNCQLELQVAWQERAVEVETTVPDGPDTEQGERPFGDLQLCSGQSRPRR